MEPVRSLSARYVDPLPSVGLFGTLSPDDRAHLAAQIVRVHYRCGVVVFVSGDPGEHMYFINSGRVRITLTSDEGKELVLAVLAAGDFFGELALIDKCPRSANAIVEDDCDLLQLPREAFRQFIRSRPEAALQVMQVLSHRLRRTDILVRDASFFDVSTRLAKLLLDLADEVGTTDDGAGVLISRGYTHEGLAERIGARRESVTKALGQFKRAGLIGPVARPGTRRHLIRVLDTPGLRQLIPDEADISPESLMSSPIGRTLHEPSTCTRDLERRDWRKGSQATW